MESSPQASPPGESVDAKTEFRKPSGEAASRKYRRRSPVNGSLSSDDSPSWQRSSGPVSRRESAKISDTRCRNDDRRDLNRDSGRSQYGRSDESHRHSDQQSSRRSHSCHRHDDYDGRGKYADNSERDYSKLPSRSGRDSRGNTYSDYSKRGNEHHSRDSPRKSEKYSHDKSDGSGHRSRDKERESSSTEFEKYKDKDSSSDRAVTGRRHTSSVTDDVKSGDRRNEDRDARDYKTDFRRESGDYRSNRSPTDEGSRGYQNDSTSRRDRSGRRLRETSWGDTKDSDVDSYRKEEKKRYDDRDRYKQRYDEESREKFEDRKSSPNKGRDSPAKKLKLFSMDASSGHVIDGEKQSSSSKQAQESAGKVTLEPAYVTDSDIDAAKIAAMKAAELVNRNLIGTGYMSTEQKKKLLWGNKKSTTAEESAHKWDTATFGDRERQEKFNKLMGVKGDVKVEQKPDMTDAEKEKIQLDLEKQYTAGLRRRDGRTVGLGL